MFRKLNRIFSMLCCLTVLCTSFAFSAVTAVETLENLALNKTATMGGSAYGGLGTANAVDGNFATAWGARWVNGDYIYVDLGQCSTVRKIDIYAQKDTAEYTIYAITGSTVKNAAWVTCEATKTKGGESETPEGATSALYHFQYELTTPVAARYVKVSMTADVRMNELQIWGTQGADATLPADAEAITVENLLNGQEQYAVVEDLTLPTAGASGSTISWKSSNPDVIANTGIVTRTTEEENVMLTATFTKNGVAVLKSFKFHVLADGAPAVKNLALKKTVKSNPGGFGGSGPEKAVDGDMDTQYGSQPGNGVYRDNHWIYADLTQDYVVHYIDAYVGNNNYVYEVYYLQDGADPAADEWQKCEVTGELTTDAVNGGFKLRYKPAETFEARYVKLASVTPDTSDNRSKLKEMQVMGTEKAAKPLVNLALKKSTQASAAYGVQGGGQVTDGDLATTFSPNWHTEAGWVYIDLGSVQDIEKLDVWARNWNAATTVSTIAGDTVDDALWQEQTASWTSAKSVPEGATEELTNAVCTPETPIKARYVRLNCGTVQVNQIQLWGRADIDTGLQEDMDAVTLEGLLDGQSANAVTQNLTLPTSGTNGSTVSWCTNKETVVAKNGTVTRPEGEDAAVTLTAIFEKSGQALRKTFTFTVKAKEADTGLQDDMNAVTPESLLNTPDTSANAVTQNLKLPTSGTNGSTISWSSDKPGVIANNGTVTRPEGADAAVTLTATFTKNGETKQKTFTFTVKAKEQIEPPDPSGLENLALGKDGKMGNAAYGGFEPAKAMDGSFKTRWGSRWGATTNWMYADLGQDNTVRKIDIYTQLNTVDYTFYYIAGDTVSDALWVNCAVTKTINGEECQPGDAAGKMYHYQFVLDTPAIARYVKMAMTKDAWAWEFQVWGTEGVDAGLQTDVNAVTPDSLLGEQDANAVTQNLTLPTAGANGSTISWKSSNPGVIAADGKVIRAEKAAFVTLTATFTKDGVSLEKQFNFSVLGTIAEGMENLSVNKPLKADEGGYAGGEYTRAADGDLKTLWNSRTHCGHWIYVDLLRTSTVHYIDLYTKNRTYDIYYINGDTVSDDAWQKLENVTMTETKRTDIASDAFYRCYQLATPVEARYVKLLCVGPTTGEARSGMFELEVMGTVEMDPDFLDDIDAVTLDTICGEQDPMALTGDINLLVKGVKGTKIEWESSNEAAIRPDGTVIPSTEEEQTVKLTAKFSKDGFTKKKVFTVKVAQILWTIESDAALLTADAIKGENRHLTVVDTDLVLPTEVGVRGTKVEWRAEFKRLLMELTMEEVLTLSGDNIGKVTRPREGTYPITLTAKLIGTDGSTAEVPFDIVIQGMGVPLPELPAESVANLALFGSAVGNGNWSSTPPSKANDGDMETAFGSAYRPAGVPTILYINLGNPHYVNKVKLYDNANNTGYTFSYSDTGVEESDWITLGSVKRDTSNGLCELEFPTVKARYVRATANSLTNASIPEFEVYGTKIPEMVLTGNLTQGCEGGGSAYEEGTYIGNLFDMDMDTYWQPVAQQGETSWVAVDLGSVKWFTDVVLYDGVEEGSYQISVSNDAKTWTKIETDESTNGINAPYEKRLVTERMEARYIKVETEAGKAPKLYEFQVYDNTSGATDANLAFGQRVTASVPAMSSENAATQVVDNDLTTEFLTKLGVPFDITIDLKQVQTADTVVVHHASQGSITKYGVSVSADGTVWKEVTKVTGGDGGSKVYSFDETGIRYVKVNVYEVESVPCGFSEIGVYYNGAASSDTDKTYNTLTVPTVIEPNYQLPMAGTGSAVITWTSSDSSIISVQNGTTVIVQPQYNTKVTLTAAISDAGGNTKQKVFHPTVRGTDGNKPFGGGNTGGGGSGRPSGGGTAITPPTGSTTNPDPVKDPYEQELQGHWGAKEISTLVEKGVVKGDGNSLHLSESVTRAEFAAMVLRMFHIEDSAAADALFNDINGTEWYAEIMRTAYGAGIVGGYDNSLRPMDTITREEAVKMADNLSGYLGKEMPAADVNFRDEGEISDWALESVAKCIGTGTILGDDTGAFRPQGALSRDEAMVIIYRLGNYFLYL